MIPFVLFNILCNVKRYFIIDQQIARHFVHYIEYPYDPLPFYATQIINPVLTSRISTNHDKSGNPYSP